jgi:hypothetical protein
MRHMMLLGLGLTFLFFGGRASAADADVAGVPAASPSHGDLFPGAGRVTVAAATGAPFLGIGEVGVGITNGFAVGVIGGVALSYAASGPTPSVPTAGIRPRLRFPTSQHTALVFIAPMLYYPSATSGLDNTGSSSWVVARPELFFDGAIGERWHLAGGMGFIAAASTEALGQLAAGRKVVMPPYGSTDTTKGFAGGLWNTVSTRTSFALYPQTNLFLESTLVKMGVLPADLGGPPPVVVTVGAQQSF